MTRKRPPRETEANPHRKPLITRLPRGWNKLNRRARRALMFGHPLHPESGGARTGRLVHGEPVKKVRGPSVTPPTNPRTLRKRAREQS